VTESLLLTIEQAAVALAVHPNTIRNLIDRGELPSVAIRQRSNGAAGRRMIAVVDLNAFIEKHTEGRQPE
jgi:excisionase family DNA binding protein